MSLLWELSPEWPEGPASQLSLECAGFGHEVRLMEAVRPDVADMDLLCPQGNPLLSFGPHFAVLGALFRLVLIGMGS